MEDLMLSQFEHTVLQKNKAKLEFRYKVKLNMPEVQSGEVNDLIFAHIVGQAHSINNVKRFLKRKLDEVKGQEVLENDKSVIILNSDSDSEHEGVLSENVKNNSRNPRRKKSKKAPPVIILDTTFDQEENKYPEKLNELNQDESIVIIEPVSNAPDFIPLASKETKKVNERSCASVYSDIIELSSDEDENNKLSIEKPIARQLRPVVIDGSNVARSHGKPTNTYSCKGIKISVEYFLQKGHPQVTAFVPLYRRHCRGGNIETTDQDILEELEKTQNVVFTPSRRVEGKTYSCYDDRFVIELAVKSGGVILSNDNFKDLLDVSPEYKETIQKRLLMFCFVGDLLMIPEDPLGMRGPNLAEFLSFPPEEKISNCSSS